jgi:hypothetical protein
MGATSGTGAKPVPPVTDQMTNQADFFTASAADW